MTVVSLDEYRAAEARRADSWHSVPDERELAIERAADDLDRIAKLDAYQRVAVAALLWRLADDIARRESPWW